ncbi:MAG: adenylyltransferase/cytidyltransferase family protein [Magnetococcales bacterium]|nr:adenylyltransferase/cytidyltransferase family protein [Magnetococcales bacterium]
MDLSREAKRQGKVVVQCHGCFDLLHIGHLRHFQEARTMGDVLIVTLTPDKFVDKGPHRPAFPQDLRAEAVAALSFVDYVAINEWPTAEKTLRLIQPDIYVKGVEFRTIESDHTGKIGRELKVIEEIGAQLRFTEDVVFSSTNLINRYLSNFPEDIQNYLLLLRQRHSVEEVFDAIEEMSNLNVLVVGDTILDDYHFTEAIGKSSKEPIIVVKYLNNDMFAGGVVSIANHIANFSNKTTLFSILGDQNDYEPFILDTLEENVTPVFFHHPGIPTIIKRRFIEGYSLNKMFEVYVSGDAPLPKSVEDQCCDWLSENLEKFDLVVVADYGHGAVTDRMLSVLVEKSPYLAVNTQANAGNRGFHTISRYPRADFICLSESELRLEMRQETGDIYPMLHDIAERLNSKHVLITRGKRGCMIRNEDGVIIEVPAFAFQVLDRIGSGDALLSVASMAIRNGTADELVGFIGNVAGALAVEIIGNQRPVDKASFSKHVKSLLK